MLAIKKILTEGGQSVRDMIHCSPALQLDFQLRFYVSQIGRHKVSKKLFVNWLGLRRSQLVAR